MKVEFIPEANGAASIARQIKQSGRAYPLFGTGRLFLERPERHRVRITSLDANVPLYQIGEGPVSFDRTILERNAFRDSRAQYYQEEVVQGEPIKGNFTNVARSRTTGVYLGPTNYHGYQPALRKLYEERFSRRMSFPEFTQREIEIVANEQAVAEWKEQARSSTTFTTTQEAEPIVLKSLAEAEQHFRKTYLPQILKSGVTLECSGQASRTLPDRSIAAAVRDAWEKERAFPAQLVNHLRPYLLEAGLHFFKHRKRVLYISAVKPVRHSAGQVFSESVAKILQTVETSPKCTRRDLAVKVLGENHEAPELADQKAALARDLHYLIHSGHVIEFPDGTLDLPLVPGGGQPVQQPSRKQGVGKTASPEVVPVEVAGDLAAVTDGEGTIAAEEVLTSGAEAPPDALVSSEFLSGEDVSEPATEVLLSDADSQSSGSLPATASADIPAPVFESGEVTGESLSEVTAVDTVAATAAEPEPLHESLTAAEAAELNASDLKGTAIEVEASQRDDAPGNSWTEAASPVVPTPATVPHGEATAEETSTSHS